MLKRLLHDWQAIRLTGKWCCKFLLNELWKTAARGLNSVLQYYLAYAYSACQAQYRAKIRKPVAAIARISFSGKRSAAKLPTKTTGTLANSMPSVVPQTTIQKYSNCAASITVATCVLSPISAIKKATKVAINGPYLALIWPSSSSVSGINVHAATARKLAAKIHSKVACENNCAT